MYYLKFDEKELPFTIDFAVVKNVCAKHNMKLSEIEKSIENPELTASVVFEGLKRGHKLEGKEFSFSESQIDEVLSFENNYGDFFAIFSTCVLKMFTPTKKN
jgi:hypothetical protein